MEDLEFGASFVLHDGFSAAARRIQREWQGLSGSVRAQVPVLDRQVQGIGASLRELAGSAMTAAVTGLRRFGGAAMAAGRAGAQLVATLGVGANGLRGALSGLGGSLGTLLPMLTVGGLVGGTIALGRAAASAGSQLETQMAGFAALLGSATAAQAHLDALRRFAATTPFEYDDLIRASQTLSGFGVAAGQQLNWLHAVGDAVFAVGGNTDNMMRVLRQMGQIASSGRATLGNINSISRNGIDVRAILREQLHMTDAQIAHIAHSAVSGQQIVQAMLTGMNARFHGGMERASQTITGLVSNLQDTMAGLLVSVGRNLTPTVRSVIGQINEVLSEDGLRRATSILTGYLETTINLVRIFVSPIASAFGDVQRGWARDTRSTGQQLQRWLGGVRLVAEGVAGLLGGSDNEGVGRIPRALQQRLVQQGLWPVAVRVAMWGDRMRRFLGGFIDRMLERFAEFRVSAQRLAESLGITRNMASPAEAQQAGRQVADLIGGYIRLRAALEGAAAAERVLSAAQAIYNAVAALNPTAWIVIGLLAFVGSVVLAVRYWDVLQARLTRMGALGSYIRLLTWPIWLFAGIIRFVRGHWDQLVAAFQRARAVFDAVYARVAPVVAVLLRVAGVVLGVVAVLTALRVLAVLAIAARGVMAFGFVASRVLLGFAAVARMVFGGFASLVRLALFALPQLFALAFRVLPSLLFRALLGAGAWIARGAMVLGGLLVRGFLAVRGFGAGIGAAVLAGARAAAGFLAQVGSYVGSLLWRGIRAALSAWGTLLRPARLFFSAVLVAAYLLVVGIGLALSGIALKVRDGAVWVGRGVVALLRLVGAGIARGAAWVWGWVVRLAQGLASAARTVGAWVAGVARTVWAAVVGVATAVGSAVAGAARAVWAWLSGVAATIWGWVRSVGLAVAQGFLAFVTGLADVWRSIWSTVSSAVAAGFQWVAGLASAVYQRVAGMVLRVVGTVRRGIVAALGTVQGWLTTLGGWLASFWDGLVAAARVVVSTIAQVARGIAEGIMTPFRWIARQLATLFNALPEQLRPTALQGLVRDLETFGAGGPPATTPPPAGAAPPAGSPELANAAPRGSPELAAAAVARSTPAAAGAVVVPAPQVTVQPASVVVQLDGAAIATAVNAHNEEQRVRQGHGG